LKNLRVKKEIKVEIYDFFECFEEFIGRRKLSKAYNTIKAQTTVKIS
jgi:hypothetical protein